MFPSPLLRLAQATTPPAATPTSPAPPATPQSSEHAPYNHASNPFKAQRTWPPDFTKLSPKHQFRFERRYKRRAQLKWARPRWMVATKLAQWIGCCSVAFYTVLYMDWGDAFGRGETPFVGVRNWWFYTLRGYEVPKGETVEAQMLVRERRRTALEEWSLPPRGER